MIRVLVADCDPVIRHLLEIVLPLEPDLEIVEVACSAQEVIEKARRLRPDVVTTCMSIPGGGVEAIRLITGSMLSAKVLVVSARSDGECVRRARDAGASGYVIKPFGPEIADAMRAAHRGAPFFRIGQEYGVIKKASRPPL
jgi:two-component system nitrate/nitrite response regulator NarL